MALRRLTMLGAAAAAGAAVVLMVPSVAWANTTPSLLAGQTGKNILASDPTFNKQGLPDCAGITHTAAQEVWVFNWPGNDAGTLLSVTIGFDNTGDQTPDVTKNLGDGQLTGDSGTLKWFVITPAGLRLETGVSEISGTTSNGSFVLTHTCAGTTTTTATPTPTTPPGDGSTPPGDGSTPPGDGSTPPGDGNLPKTGVAIGGIVVTGIGLIAGGAVLMLARRRRDATDPS